MLVHVIDEGPRHDLDRLRGRCTLITSTGRNWTLPKRKRETMLKEASRRGLRAGARGKRTAGAERDWHVVVELARETKTRTPVVLYAADRPGHPRLGPHSVGMHTARFVVDHSPTHVLLLRESGQSSE